MHLTVMGAGSGIPEHVTALLLVFRPLLHAVINDRLHGKDQLGVGIGHARSTWHRTYEPSCTFLHTRLGYRQALIADDVRDLAGPDHPGLLGIVASATQCCNPYFADKYLGVGSPSWPTSTPNSVPRSVTVAVGVRTTNAER